MVHYSSNLVCHEGGAKNPLKGISMKFLVNARVCQTCVFSGSKDFGGFCYGKQKRIPKIVEAYLLFFKYNPMLSAKDTKCIV